MQPLISDIIRYIEYLNTACGLSTSVHFSANTIATLPEAITVALLKYSSHNNPYCIVVKSKAGGYHNCIKSQRRVLDKCAREGSFCGSCYAGVYEYIHPVWEKGKAVGFIAVSGYRQTGRRVRVIDETLYRSSLKEEALPVEQARVLIPPLARMLELLVEYPAENTDSEYNRMLNYISDHYAHLSLEQLCRQFGRSKSYISHLFNEKTGMTLRSYCNKLKLSDAKKLLVQTNLPITEIAFNTGFQDVSYFISVFKQDAGLTPLKYRQKKLSGE